LLLPKLNVTNFQSDIVFDNSDSFFCIASVMRASNGETGVGVGGATGLRPLSNINLKNVDNVDTMVSDVVRDLSFSRNRPLQSVMTSTFEF
jgi:hypothetical protein